MKKPIQKSISIALSLCLAATLFSVPSHAEDGEETAPVSVNMDSVYELSYSGNINSKIAVKKMEAFYHDIRELEDSIHSAWELVGSSDPMTKLYGNLTLQTLIPKQVSDEGKESAELSSELTKRQVALGGRSMLTAYYSTQLQLALLTSESERLARETAALGKMSELGLRTELEANTLAQSLDKLKSSVKTIEDSLSRLKTQLAIYIGASEQDMTIEAFQGCSAAEAKGLLTAIDYSADLEAAKKASLTIKIQELKIKDSDGAQKDAERLALKKLNDQFPIDFEALYQKLSYAASDIKNAEEAYRLSGESFKYAELKYGLGIISRLEFENTRSQHLSEGKRLELARLAFSSAHYNYKAMLGGVWQQSSE